MTDPLLSYALLRHLTQTNYATLRGFVRHQLAMAEWVSGRLAGFTAARPERVRRLVFVCLGNINRSAFGHAVAQQLGARSASIGLSTTTGAPAFDKAVVTARRFGIDLTQHAATDFSDFVYEDGDLLLTMEVRHLRELARRGLPRDALALLGAWAYPKRIHIHDPHLASDAYFMTCFTLIQAAVEALVHELREQGSAAISV